MCKCKVIQCGDRRCGCLKYGRKCTSMCECIGCLNTGPNMNQTAFYDGASGFLSNFDNRQMSNYSYAPQIRSLFNTEPMQRNLPISEPYYNNNSYNMNMVDDRSSNLRNNLDNISGLSRKFEDTRVSMHKPVIEDRPCQTELSMMRQDNKISDSISIIKRQDLQEINQGTDAFVMTEFQNEEIKGVQTDPCDNEYIHEIKHSVNNNSHPISSCNDGNSVERNEEECSDESVINSKKSSSMSGFGEPITQEYENLFSPQPLNFFGSNQTSFNPFINPPSTTSHAPRLGLNLNTGNAEVHTQLETNPQDNQVIKNSEPQTFSINEMNPFKKLIEEAREKKKADEEAKIKKEIQQTEEIVLKTPAKLPIDQPATGLAVEENNINIDKLKAVFKIKVNGNEVQFTTEYYGDMTEKTAELQTKITEIITRANVLKTNADIAYQHKENESEDFSSAIRTIRAYIIEFLVILSTIGLKVFLKAKSRWNNFSPLNKKLILLTAFCFLIIAQISREKGIDHHRQSKPPHLRNRTSRYKGRIYHRDDSNPRSQSNYSRPTSSGYMENNLR